MKKLFLLVLLCFSPAFIFAGPFGLSMGMNISQITEACGGNRPERIENDDRYFILPEKKHSTFVKYIAWIDNELCRFVCNTLCKDWIHIENVQDMVLFQLSHP